MQLISICIEKKVYPTEHPALINENFDYSLQNYFGFIKCKVEAPRGLYLPVLPVSYNGKIVFPLCVNCMQANDQKECRCGNSRSFVGTWTTEEVKLAIEKGYKIKQIYEVLHYENQDAKLFSLYINMWLKIKQQASGWPSWCQSEDDKRKYIENYLAHEEVLLDYDSIEKNEALRFIAKIMLNSFWGKMAQRPNQPKVEIVKTYERFWQLATDENIEINSEFMPNDDTALVNWEFINDEDDLVKSYNIAIASYVTAYARIELYKLMEKIEKIRPFSLLYHDTDSVIYYRKLTDPEITCGDYLGDLADEIKKNYGENAKCTAFVSLGPKNYAYEVKKENGIVISEIKSKGITLTGLALEKINFKKMVDMAIKYSIERKTEEIDIPQRQFVLNRHTQIFTRHFDKVYQAVSTKRVINNNNITLPYGF